MNNRTHRYTVKPAIAAGVALFLGSAVAIGPALAATGSSDPSQAGSTNQQTGAAGQQKTPMSGQTANQPKKSPLMKAGSSDQATSTDSSMKSAKAKRTNQMTGAAGDQSKPASGQAANQPKSAPKAQ